MSMQLTSVVLAGSTGLVGSNILSTLLPLPTKPIIHALTRKKLPHNDPNLNTLLESDSSQWPAKIEGLVPVPDAFVTAMGTTRGQAGSFEAQRKIDYDLNLAMARSAHAGGIKVLVIMSSAGTSASSPMPYAKMKVQLEDAVKTIGFPHVVILRPGLLVGSRQDSRMGEYCIRSVARGLGAISKGLTDFWAQDASVVARAAVAATQQCVEGKRPEGVWTLQQADVVRLGREEWKEQD